MATIQSQLNVRDGMSPILRRINQNLQTLTGSFIQMQQAGAAPIATQNMQAAVSGLNQIFDELGTVTAEINDATTAQHGFNAAVSAGSTSIQTMRNSQNGFNASVQAGNSSLDGMLSKVKGVVATLAAASGIRNLIGTSDQMAGATARLSLIVDDQNSVESLQQKIFASAQASRGAYLDVMDTVGKLGLTAGDAFTGNDEMIRFAQLMNQNFIIAGASATEQSSAMYQLTQAMAAGKLQGDEYRSIIENAPLLANSIEEYMRNVQGATGSMKDWAAEGLLTSDVIKAALFSSADEIEARFAQMPRTWSQNWTMMKNNALIALQPLYNYIGQLANDPRVLTAINEITGAISGIAQIAIPVIDLIVSGLAWTGENLEWIMPLLLGVAAAYVLIHGAMIAYNTVMAISNGLQAVKAARLAMTTVAEGAQTTATFAATAAQYGFNAALYACPIVWILLIIIAVIAAIYGVVAAINHLTGSTLSATGIIAGAFMVAFAFIGNILIAAYNLVVDVFVLIYNLVAEVANFIGNVFVDPIGAVCRLFFGLADTVLGILQALASAIDAIFGSNLAGAVQGWRDSLGGWVDDTFGQGEQVMAKLNANDLKLDRFEYGAAWDLGYNAGAGLEASIGDMFSFDPSSLTTGFDPNSVDMSGYQPALDGINDNTGSTAASLKNMSEDVAYMRDIAEREAINRFTTAELHIDMTGMNNRFENDMDVDGVIDRFVTGVTEALDVAGEGVHP